MEITSFVLGMLTIVAAGISASIVVGLAKINQLTRKTESLQQLCAAIEGDLRREIEDKNREVWKQFEITGRDVSMVEKTILNQIDHIDREHHKHEEELHRAIGEAKSYIDSRIDKVVLKGSWEGSKQILKG
jgi:hypothetical protein